jgi:anaphase-promoting complex subunit 11
MPLKVTVKHWHAAASWTWNAGDDVCGICRMPFDGCPPGSKFPGDDSPVVWGTCGHAFHLQCISKWLQSDTDQVRCFPARGAASPRSPRAASAARNPLQRALR